jgi:hypothetical protein
MVKRTTVEYINIDDHTFCSCCVSDEQYEKIVSEHLPVWNPEDSADVANIGNTIKPKLNLKKKPNPMNE